MAIFLDKSECLDTYGSTEQAGNLAGKEHGMVVLRGTFHGRGDA